MRTVTYKSRPPTSARAARRAWDYFVALRKYKRRVIKELYYSRWYDFSYPAWVCEWSMLPSDTEHYAFSTSLLTDFAASATIKKL